MSKENKNIGKVIKMKWAQMEQIESEIKEIAKTYISDFHFLNYEVSNFWDCEKSPIGVCVFKLDDYGRKTYCRYCHDPVERK